MAKKSGDYEVGFGKPPKDSQFKKGKSGNPGGRPKVKKTFVEALDEALEEEVSVSVNGEQRRLTCRDVVAKAAVNKAAKGSVAAMAFIDKTMARTKPEETGERHFEVTLELDDKPAYKPGFMDLFELYMEINPNAIPEEGRKRYEQILSLKEYVLENAHLFPENLVALAAE